MAVSYLSKTFQNSPYVPPVDLNVMAKVLSFQQGRFDENANKIQSQLDTIANTDLLRGVDKDYVNNKLNTIVQNINSLGGVNLSDYNISNQVSGYASSIYNDDNVLTAIASTKKARSLMSSYDKMKSDPKLIKYYSEANEYNDNKHLNEWMNDSRVGASYRGPSTATRFEDYNKDFTDILQRTIPQQFTKLTTGNGYIEKETGKVLSEKRVYEIAQGMLNPIQRDQMQRDATYLYEAKAKYGKADLVNKALSISDNKISDETDLLARLKGAYAAESNPTEKHKLQEQIDEKSQYVSALQRSRSQEVGAYSSMYDSNPNELMYRVYSNDYFNALGKRFAINQVDKTLTGDPVMLAKFNQANQNARQANEINASFKLQAMRDASAMARETLQSETSLAVAGIRSNKNGQATIDDPLASGNINPNTSTLNEDQRRAVAAQKAGVAKDQMDSIQNEYVNKVIAEHPNMTPEDARVSFNMITEAMAEKVNMKEGMIKNLPKGFGETLEQYNLLKFQHDNYLRGAMTGALNRPQYLTKTITPDEQNNLKDPNYRTFESIKNDLKNKGLINDAKDVTFKEAYAAPDETGGFKISYVEGDGKKQSKVKEYDLTPERAKLLGFIEPPNNLGILNNNVDKGKDFVTYVQNEQDPNFVGKIRVYKIKDGEFGAQYLYGNNVPVNLLKNGNASMPADAYYRASQILKKYRSGKIDQNKYQTKLDFEKDLGITPSAPVVDDWSKSLNLRQFK